MSTPTPAPLRPVEFHILLSLTDGDLHGYGIIQATEARTEGRMVLEPATLYRALRRLAAQGWIEAVAHGAPDDPGNERRRYYALTELGRTAARDEARRLEILLEAARGADLLPSEPGP